MKKISKNILFWEIGSALFVIFIGFMLHFVFEWSGYSSIVGAFSAVNESVWEHTKLAFFPILIFSLLQYPFIKKEFTNYFTLKLKELALAVILIIVIFYTYSGVLGQHYLALDILDFVVSVILAKFLAYIHLFNKTKGSQILPIALIVALGLFFIYATFYPPKIQLFKDAPTGTYGIVKNIEKGVACTMEAKICPDGSAVGRQGPKCEFTPCPTNSNSGKTPIYDPVKEEIQSLFIAKYPKYAKTIEISINKEVPGYVRGQVSFERGAPGGIFFAKKTDGKWEVVHEGNGQISCALSDLGFPESMLYDCAK